MRLLLTRPLEQSKSSRDFFKTLGHEVTVEPLLKIAPLDNPMPQKNFDAIILTSVNSVPSLDQSWVSTNRHDVPVFTTGKATSTAARQAGFTNIMVEARSATDLVAKTFAGLNTPAGACNKFLYPCAKITAHDVPELLRSKGVFCTPWPVYETVETQAFSQGVKSALLEGKIDGVLLYSPRSAACFANLFAELSKAPRNFQIYVLSKNIADSLPKDWQTSCIVAENPSDDALALLLKA